MKTETLEGDIKSAHGKELPEAQWLKYAGPLETYETATEVKAANDLPSDDEVVSFRNQQKRAATRQRLITAEIDRAAKAFREANPDVNVLNPYEKPTLANSADLRYKTIYDALIAAGKSAAEADMLAKAALQ